MCTSYRCEWLAWRSKAEELTLEASEREEHRIRENRTDRTDKQSRTVFSQRCLLRSWWMWTSLKLWQRSSCQKWFLTILPRAQMMSILWERIGKHSLVSGNNLLLLLCNNNNNNEIQLVGLLQSGLPLYCIVCLLGFFDFPTYFSWKMITVAPLAVVVEGMFVAVPLQFQCWILIFSHLQFGAYIVD